MVTLIKKCSLFFYPFLSVWMIIRRRQLNCLFAVRAVGRIISSRSVSKMIIILTFRVGLSKTKNIDHQSKDTSAIFSLTIQNKNSAINVFLPFLFDFFLHKSAHLTKSTFFNIKFLLF